MYSSKRQSRMVSWAGQRYKVYRRLGRSNRVVWVGRLWHGGAKHSMIIHYHTVSLDKLIETVRRHAGKAYCCQSRGIQDERDLSGRSVGHYLDEPSPRNCFSVYCRLSTTSRSGVVRNIPLAPPLRLRLALPPNLCYRPAPPLFLRCCLQLPTTERKKATIPWN